MYSIYKSTMKAVLNTGILNVIKFYRSKIKKLLVRCSLKMLSVTLCVFLIDIFSKFCDITCLSKYAIKILLQGKVAKMFNN